MIFVIIVLARFFGPELFGIYNLALSVILMMLIFSDLGINSAAIRFIAKALRKNQRNKASSYFRYLFKVINSILFTGSLSFNHIKIYCL